MLHCHATDFFVRVQTVIQPPGLLIMNPTVLHCQADLVELGNTQWRLESLLKHTAFCSSARSAAEAEL